MQIRRFERDRWCFHIGPIEIVWMRRKMPDHQLEHLIRFSWLTHKKPRFS